VPHAVDLFCAITGEFMLRAEKLDETHNLHLLRDAASVRGFGDDVCRTCVQAAAMPPPQKPCLRPTSGIWNVLSTSSFKSLLVI
jgi:hypothetical protein